MELCTQFFLSRTAVIINLDTRLWAMLQRCTVYWYDRLALWGNSYLCVKSSFDTVLPQQLKYRFRVHLIHSRAWITLPASRWCLHVSNLSLAYDYSRMRRGRNSWTAASLANLLHSGPLPANNATGGNINFGYTNGILRVLANADRNKNCWKSTDLCNNIIEEYRAMQ